MTAGDQHLDKEQVRKGQAIYNKAVLNVYDLWVLGVSNRFIWKCPTPILLDWFNQHVSSNHLEIAVGTGYYLKHCRYPSSPSHVSLLDMNPNTLHYAHQRIQNHALNIEYFERNVFEPFALNKTYDSICLNYMLHCLPGPLREKAAIVFKHCHPWLNEKGVIFGSTILYQGEGIQKSGTAQALMQFYNKKGVFSNTEDNLDALIEVLEEYAMDVQVEVTGCVARFAGIKKSHAC